MSYYTLVVWTDENGERVRNVVDPDWRMPWHVADEMAGKLNAQDHNIRLNRTYKAVNCNEFNAKKKGGEKQKWKTNLKTK